MPGNRGGFLSPEEVTTVNEASMALLAKVGVAFYSDKAIAIFKVHGLPVDGRLVYLLEEEIMDAVAAAPPHFTIRGRGHNKTSITGLLGRSWMLTVLAVMYLLVQQNN